MLLIILDLIANPANGKPLAIPLANVIISGSTIPSDAHHFPALPAPVCTSSIINTILCLLNFFQLNFKKSFLIGITPPSPKIGSIIIPAVSFPPDKFENIYSSSFSD